MLLPAVSFDDQAQCFKVAEDEQTDALVAEMDRPLSLTFQLTRNCNFRCVYCSEPPGVRTRTRPEVLEMIDKLQGMRRIISFRGTMLPGSKISSTTSMLRLMGHDVSMTPSEGTTTRSSAV